MVNRRASGVHADIHVLDVEARRSVTGDPRNADFADIRCTAGVGDIWRGAESFALDRCAASCWRKHIGVGASWVVEFERKNRVSTSISVACSRCLANGEFTADNKVDHRRLIDSSHRFTAWDWALYRDVARVRSACRS